MSKSKQFLDAYKKSYKANKDSSLAYRVGLEVDLRTAMNKPVEVITAKGRVTNVYENVSKSEGVSGKSYFAEVIFSDVNKDRDGDSVPQQTFFNDMKGVTGDLEHVNGIMNGTIESTPEDIDIVKHFDRSKLFTVINSVFDGTNMIGTIKFNKDHKQFSQIWDNAKKGNFGASMEYARQSIGNGMRWVVKGVTGTLDPRVRNAKVLRAFEKEE